MASTATTDLDGLWVPLVSPFTDDAVLDMASFSRLGARILGDGASGLVALGTTGEAATLSQDERCRLTVAAGEIAVAHGAGLIVGAGSNHTDGTIAEIARLAALVDMTAALVVVPYYSRPSETAIVEHFRLVADESAVPVVVYNVPYRTGQGLGASALIELADHPNIVGLKQATGALDKDTLEVLKSRPEDFAVLAGDDAFIAPTMLMGASGAIAAAAHLCTNVFAKLVAAAAAGDSDMARLLAESVLPVVTAGFSEPNPAVFKAALAAMGELRSGAVRRPLAPASTKATRQMIDAAKRCELATSSRDPRSMLQ